MKPINNIAYKLSSYHYVAMTRALRAYIQYTRMHHSELDWRPRVMTQVPVLFGRRYQYWRLEGSGLLIPVDAGGGRRRLWYLTVRGAKLLIHWRSLGVALNSYDDFVIMPPREYPE